MKGKRHLLVYACMAALVLLLASAAYAQAPTLPLKKSIELAETAISKTNVDPAKYYLYSVTLSHSAQGQFCSHIPPLVPSNTTRFRKVYLEGLSGFPRPFCPGIFAGIFPFLNSCNP
jgi:hypothetical protein